MNPFPVNSQALYDAAISGDFAQVEALAASSDVLNVINGRGESLLESVTSYLAENPELEFRTSMLRLLIERGANPNLLGEEGSSPLTAAMLGRDSELLEILLEAGANPNLPEGFTSTQSFYDWAVFDYIYEIWEVPFHFSQAPRPEAPNPPSPEDKVSEESWLQYLDRCAIKDGLERPNHLILLRKYGAMTARELSAKVSLSRPVH